MRNWYKRAAFILLYGVLAHGVAAQQLLTKEEAVRLTLENNFLVQLARNTVRIADNNNSIFNTGQLPTVTATAATGFEEATSRTDFSDGSTTKTRGASTGSAQAGISAAYLIFDGNVRSLQIEKLQENRSLADLELRRRMELSKSQLLQAYYSAANLAEMVILQREALEVSRHRLERVGYQFEYGQGIRLNVLNAELDLQRDSVTLKNLQNLLNNARRNLNIAMGRSASIPFEVDTSVVYVKGLTLESLLDRSLRNNVDLLLSEMDISLSTLDQRIIERSTHPSVSATASYTYATKVFDAQSAIDWQYNNGLNAGISMRWPLFDGGQRRTREANNRIALENLHLSREQLRREVEGDVLNTWQNYQHAFFVMQAERNTLATAQLNFERSSEQYNLGQITSVEFRQAQLNLLTAATNLSRAKYDAKQFELQLLLLSGELLNVSTY